MSDKAKAILITGAEYLTDEDWDEIGRLGRAVGVSVFAVTSQVKMQVVEADVSALLIAGEKVEGESIEELTARIQKALHSD